MFASHEPRNAICVSSIPRSDGRIELGLRGLADGAPTGGERKLKGGDEWRLRVGDWRVRFVRDFKTRTILVTRILPRGRAYDR